MIDEQKLIKDILYSNNWNNQKCPEWVINMIKSQPVRSAARPLSIILGTMFDEEDEDE